MTAHIELWPLSQRHHTASLTPAALADLGFGYSRTPGDELALSSTVPDGVDLIALTGRARPEVTR